MMHRFKGLLTIFFIFFAAISCSPHSLDDFEEEGKGVIRSLIQELKAIHNREQLLASTNRLQQQFDRLAILMIAAKEFSFAHPELDKGEFFRNNHDLSDQLRVELNRLYRIEGGRQMIEKCQEKALHRLDAFEKRHAKN